MIDGSRERYSETPRTACTAANACDVYDFYFQPEKELLIHQTTQLKHLGLCTVACIPEPVKDVDKLKQRLIEVLAGCMQQTVVSDVAGEQKKKFWVCSHVIIVK